MIRGDRELRAFLPVPVLLLLSAPLPLSQVVDLLVAMCRAALESPRKSIIFEPYPSVVDPNDPKTLAFNPKVSARGPRGLRGLLVPLPD